MRAIPIDQLRKLIAPFLILSFLTNFSILVSPIFMMQVLDRVVPSANSATLLLLLFVALIVLAANAVIEATRDRSLSRISRWIHGGATPAILSQTPARQQELFNSLEILRQFFCGGKAIQLMNLAWLPLFLIVLYMIHPAYAALVVAIVAVSQFIHWCVSNLSRSSAQISKQLGQSEGRMFSQLSSWALQPRLHSIRQNIADNISDTRSQKHAAEDRAEGPETIGAAFGNFLRLASQLFALSLGAYLVALDLQSTGAMIGASIVAAKTIASSERSLETLKSLSPIKQAFQEIGALTTKQTDQVEVAELSGSLTCKNLIYPRGEGAPPRLDRISFELQPGECLVIIGDAASGKSSLLNALAGLDRAPIGSVFLDQSDMRVLGNSTYVREVGYLTQHATLIPGTIFDNISGFEPDAQDHDVIDAAKRAKVHGLISALPEGYRTDLSANPNVLTAGQRQQIAMAAALYGNPKYVFLDEPNSLLDRVAERNLCNILATLKAEGTTIIMVLHRSGAISLADKVLAMERGRMVDFGLRADVLSRHFDGSRNILLPLRESSLQDLADWIENQFTRNGDAGFSAKAVLLGTEMFQAAFLNGDVSEKREIQISFKFINEENCEIRMFEKGFTAAEEILIKINSAMDEGDFGQDDFGASGRPLMCAKKIASQFDVVNKDNHAVFFAHLSMDRAPSMKAFKN